MVQAGLQGSVAGVPRFDLPILRTEVGFGHCQFSVDNISEKKRT
jgi:hypothetical protein